MWNNINNIQAILNEKMLRDAFNPLDLMVYAARDEDYDGDYRAAVMKAEDLLAAIGGLSTVETDGVTITGSGVVGDPLVATPPLTSPAIVKNTFAQADFATDTQTLAAAVGNILIVKDYNVTGFGGSFIKLATINNSYLDWVVLATDATASVGFYGNNPL